jgi:hypothetical protein
MTAIKYRLFFIFLTLTVLVLLPFISACQGKTVPAAPSPPPEVPHQEKWGIYALDPADQSVSLIYSTSSEIQASAIRLNSAGDRFVFAQQS